MAPDEARANKACPFCAEEILDAAIKCKHCGSALAGEPQLAKAEPAAMPPPDATNRAGVVGSIVACGVLGLVVWYATTSDISSKKANATPMGPDVEVALSELVDAFRANDVAAASKYADRFVVTSGKVQNMGSLGSSDFYVIFDVGSESAQCYTTQRAVVEALHRGSPIRVRGRATGHIIYLQLKDCTIL